MLSSLLAAARTMHPGDLAAAVAEQGAAAGIGDVVVYLADRDQRVLTPIGAGDVAVERVDGSLAGRCYQRAEPVLAEAPGAHAWLPVLAGAARMGVMRASLEGPGALDRAQQLATLTAYLVRTKMAVGDELSRAINAEPMALAAEMRWAALPPLSFEHARVAVGAMLQPAYEIAGDTFDYAVEGDLLHMAVFDAMGHGLQASTLANMAVYAYRVGRRQGRTLEEIYRSIDEVVNAQFGDDCFVTAQLANINLATGRLRSISAGHPPPLLLRDRTHVQELEVATHLPIGMGQTEVAVTDQRLQPGDTLAYYSDGISEARSPNGEQFGLERLQELLVREAASDAAPPETARRALHAVMEHHADHLEDDATLVLVTWRGDG